MFKKFNRNFLIIIYFLILLGLNTKAQVKTNYDVVENLTAQAISEITNNLPGGENSIVFNYYSSKELMVLKSNFIYALKERNYKLSSSENNDLPKLDITVSSVDVNYTDTFRDGLLGSYLVERKVDLQGSFFISENGNISGVRKFFKTNTDTLDYDLIEIAEDRTLPFTQSELPAEPFFSSLLEPVVAIGAAAVTIYLFFTVRSK